MTTIDHGPQPQTVPHSPVPRPAPGRWAALAGCGLLAAGMLFPADAQIIEDNFNDGNDTGWTRYDPLGSVGAGPQATYTFPTGGYRIQASRHPAIPPQAGPARGGSYRAQTYSDFYMTADLVNWNDTMDQSIGLLARMSQLGLGTTDGYALTYQTADHDVDITRFTDEGGVELFSVPLNGEDAVTLVPGRSYRLVWIGKGPDFTVRIYELPDLTTPILEVTGNDGTYPSGVCGFLVYDNSTDGTAGVADATFDNFLLQDVEPPRLTLAREPFGDISVQWPSDATGFVLQAAEQLPARPEDWVTIETPIPGYYTENALTGKKFFRLIRP